MAIISLLLCSGHLKLEWLGAVFCFLIVDKDLDVYKDVYKEV